MRDDGPETTESTLSHLCAMVPVTVACLFALILVPLVISAVTNRRGFHDHRPDRAVDGLKEIRKGIQIFHLETGRFPLRLEELTTPTEEWPEAWLWELPADPWKGEIYYRITGTGFLLGSTGPDRERESEDDIVLEGP